MPSQANVERVEGLKDVLSRKKNFIISSFSGITVNEINSLRNELRQKGVEFKVIKNSLFSIALKEKGYEDSFHDSLKGPNIVAFVDSDLSGPAKTLNDFKKSRDEPPLEMKVGVAEGTVYSKEEIEQIANLPSKDLLLAKLMATINNPASGIAGVMNSLMGTLARAIEAVAKKSNPQ